MMAICGPCLIGINDKRGNKFRNKKRKPFEMNQNFDFAIGLNGNKRLTFVSVLTKISLTDMGD